jgi:hypothetical protein
VVVILNNVVCIHQKKKIFLLSEICSFLKASVNREYVLIPKDVDYNQAPQSRYMSFDDVNQASIVQKTDFSGQLNNDFTIRMWMKHSNEGNNDKEHIFCKSDEKCKKIFRFLIFL